jgi:integrase
MKATITAESESKSVEHPKGSGITIRAIVNRTGEQVFGESYIVTLPGKVSGKGRVRKQFRTLADAKAFAADSAKGVRAVGSKFVELDHGDRDATLRLLSAIKERGGDAQSVVDDVIASLKGIGASPVRLTECVAFALPRLAPSRIVTVLEAAESLRQSKVGEISRQYARVLGVQLDRIVEKLGELPVTHLDAIKVNDFIGSLRKRDTTGADGKIIPGKPASPKFRKHILGALRLLVRHAVSKGWLAKGVVDFEIVQSPRQVRGGAIHIFSAEEIASLLEHAEPDLIPFLAIGAFSGLRSMEIERLDWRHVDLAQGHIEITASNAKTAARRLAHVPANLTAWLAPIHQGTGRVFPISTAGGNLSDRLSDLAKRAGLTGWRKNGLRHSFISHRVAMVQDVAACALECGNSPAIIFANYRSVVTKAEATKYFAVVPTKARASNITVLAAAAVA